MYLVVHEPARGMRVEYAGAGHGPLTVDQLFSPELHAWLHAHGAAPGGSTYLCYDARARRWAAMRPAGETPAKRTLERLALWLDA
jgi:hypothetical protein